MRIFCTICVICLIATVASSGPANSTAWVISKTRVGSYGPTNAWLVVNSVKFDKAQTEQIDSPKKATKERQMASSKIKVNIPVDGCFSIGDDTKCYCGPQILDTQLFNWSGTYVVRGWLKRGNECKLDIKSVWFEPGEQVEVSLFSTMSAVVNKNRSTNCQCGDNCQCGSNTAVQSIAPVYFTTQPIAPVRNFISNCKNGICTVR